MILAHGQIYEESLQKSIISSLKKEIPATLEGPKLEIEKIYAAAERLYQRVLKGEFDELAAPLLAMAHLSHETFLEYAKEFSAEGLRKKVELELGKDPFSPHEISSHHFAIRRPLGVLLHIAAGNVDFLPAYSVLEGLLAGNINLLKLPSGDKGLSVKLLQELIQEEPSLSPYIYVFDVPSTEVDTLKELSHYADAVVVWGGDFAVKGVREFADPNSQIITWGHKLSFAYVDQKTSDEDLRGLAEDICLSNQMLCSSCQGLYYDGSDEKEIEEFAKRFVSILSETNARMGPAALGMRAKSALAILNEKMEGRGKIFQSPGVSAIVYPDSDLLLSFLFRNVWIKPLPEEKIVEVLKPYRGYLQTCALLVEQEKRAALRERFFLAGLTRLSGPHMSLTEPGEAHDGSYALSRYTRIVDYQE